LKGSPLGFGTDIGGSIRIPAAFNGLYGLRPSAGRLPYEGMANSMDGQNSILSVVGPIATSVGALRLVIKALLSKQPWFHDPLVAEIPWRHEQEQAVLDIARSSGGGRLVFGLLKGDDTVLAQPPLLRALDMAVKTAEKLGHKVIEWQPPSHARGLEIAVNPPSLGPMKIKILTSPRPKPGSSMVVLTVRSKTSSPSNQLNFI